MITIQETSEFCVFNSISFKALNNKHKKSWPRVKESLGDRLRFMVYSKENIFSAEPYVIDLLMNTNYLGIEVSAVLKEKMRECSYPMQGKPIVIYDVFKEETIPNKALLFSENNIVVGINDLNTLIEVFICKI